MYAIDVFDVDDYVLFNFEESLKRIYRNTPSEKIIIYTCDCYFAVPTDLFNEKGMRFDCEVFEQEFINKQQIIIGKLNSFNTLSTTAMPQFLYELIKEECIWIRYFLDIIIKHLSTRDAEGLKLTNHTNIRILIGKTVQALEEIECLVNAPGTNTTILEYLKELISKACNYLAKLVGGRALLSSSIVEMMCTFDAINHIYLCVRE